VALALEGPAVESSIGKRLLDIGDDIVDMFDAD